MLLPKLLVTSGFPWPIGGVLPVYSHCFLSVHVYSCFCALIFPFDKDTNHIELRLI